MSFSRRFSLLVLFAMLFAGAASTVQAQNLRSDRSVFLKARVGVSWLLNDTEQSPFNFNLDSFDRGKFPLNAGIELGYQFTQPFGVSIGYQYGDYPNITEFNTPPAVDDMETVRQTVTLLGQYMFGAANNRLSPYVMFGLNASFGTVEQVGSAATEDETSFGPSFGIGLDLKVGDKASIFIQNLSHMGFPDEALDGLEEDFSFPDLLNGLTFGLKYNFKAPFVPVEILALDGPMELETGTSGAFTATANVDEATPEVTYTWDMGDGTTLTGPTVSHTYSSEGTYTVTVTASNGRSSDSRTMSVAVTDPVVPPRIVSILADPAEGIAGEPTRFTANVEGDGPFTYQWDFGDGSTSTQANPTHTYDEPGTYTVTLTVTNEGGTDTRTLSYQVVVGVDPICLEITEMNSVFFGRNDSQLTPEARERLTENADILTRCPDLRANVMGFASLGERNPQALSEARAEAVAQFYRDLGVNPNQLVVRGMGRAEGMTSKKDGASQFRRVDTVPIR
ncbi:MAG: PKD domain-containing protein [Bacteroidota bacterium]